MINKKRYPLHHSDNIHFHDYFVRALMNSKNLQAFLQQSILFIEEDVQQTIDFVIPKESPFKGLPVNEFITKDLSTLRGIAAYHELVSNIGLLLESRCSLDELEAKIERQEANLKIYEERIEIYAPVFEKQSAEANANFETTWEKAVRIINKDPRELNLRLIIDGYPIKEQADPKTFNQDLKNQCYMAIVSVLDHIANKLNNGSMKKV